MKQFCVTTAMGKRLIGKAMIAHPVIKATLEKGTLVIIAGSTNGYVAEEILGALGQGDDFSRVGFRRGLTVAPGAKAEAIEFPGDVILINGNWQLKGKTINDVADDLKAGDVVLKGANAFDARRQPAVQIGHPKGGTLFAVLPTLVGRRVRLIMPVGLEKRVLEDVNVLAARCNSPDCEGPRLCPVPAQIFTEIDALKLLTGAEACLLAAGGVHGAEGAVWLGVDGTQQQIDAAAELINAVASEPACRV